MILTEYQHDDWASPHNRQMCACPSNLLAPHHPHKRRQHTPDTIPHTVDWNKKRSKKVRRYRRESEQLGLFPEFGILITVVSSFHLNHYSRIKNILNFKFSIPFVWHLHHHQRVSVNAKLMFRILNIFQTHVRSVLLCCARNVFGMYTIIEKSVNLMTWSLSDKYIISISHICMFIQVI